MCKLQAKHDLLKLAVEKGIVFTLFTLNKQTPFYFKEREKTK